MGRGRRHAWGVASVCDTIALLSSRVLLPLWCLAAAILLSLNLGGWPLLDADEGRNGEVGREMAATNDYVMPRLDGMPYLDKPIVYFAAEAAVMKVTGPTEFAARFPAWLLRSPRRRCSRGSRRVSKSTLPWRRSCF